MQYLKTLLAAVVAAWIFLLPVSLPATESLSDAVPVVNINTASPDELSEALNGVGVTKAQAIVEYREQHGRFESAEDLARVRGIGQATVDKNRDRIRLN